MSVRRGQGRFDGFFCVDPSPENLKYFLPLDHELRTKPEVSKDAQWSRCVRWIGQPHVIKLDLSSFRRSSVTFK